MIKTLIFSQKKSKILSKIAKEKQKGFNLTEITSDKIEKLYSLLNNDNATLFLLKKFNKTNEDLRNIVQKLELCGAGQVVRGHYVPISSIAFIDTLELLLEHWNGVNFEIKNYNTADSNMLIASKMIERF